MRKQNSSILEEKETLIQWKQYHQPKKKFKTGKDFPDHPNAIVSQYEI